MCDTSGGLPNIVSVEQLAWLGNTGYPLWTLAIIAFEVIVLYALTARWDDAAVDPL